MPQRPTAALKTRRHPCRNLLLSALAGLSGVAVLGSALPGHAEVPATWDEVARDSFSRTLSGSWGTSEVGGPYTLSNSGVTVGTSGSAGTATLDAGESFGATLPKISASDVDISDTFALDAGPSSYDVFASWAVRQQNDGSAYTGRVRLNQSGAASLAVARKNGSSSTGLASFNLPFTVGAGQAVRGELQTTGTSPVMVRARVWLVGSTRPAWQVQFSDSSSSRIQSKGSVGLWDYVQSASSPIKIRHDDVSVGAAKGASTSSTPPPTAPVTTPPPPASGGATSARGTTLGTARYAVPSDALYVDSGRGSDGSAGTESSPLKTAAKAAAKAAAGQTIVLRGGTYHESVSVTNDKRLTIQNYPGEVVWFDGSVPLTNWTQSGNKWVSTGWTAKFDSSMGSDAAFKARFISANPMAADADQVFLNGSQLTQVASDSAVTSGTFAVNDSAGTITIGSDPAGKEVRASDLETALTLAGRGTVVEGIGVRRYATTYQNRGAVRLSNVGSTIRNVVITDNAMMGLSMSNTNKQVDHVVVTNSGMLGVDASKNDNSTITNSIVDNNNTQDFKDAPVAGGVKFTASRGVVVSNNEFKNNKGSGLWFDVSCYDMKVVGNDSQNNRAVQISIEVSAKAVVANNTAFGGVIGILVYDSSDVKIWNNEIGGTTTFGIQLSQDARRQAEPGNPEGRDPRAPVPDPTVTWIVKNVTVSNNVFGNGGYFQFYALDKETNRPADSMNIVLNGNLFNKRVNKNVSQPTMVAWGQGDNHTLVRYETPEELKAKNSGWSNAQTPDSIAIADMGPFKIQDVSVALPLPSDVAAAAGLTAGSKKLGRY